ncbi:FAD binding domain-containing protein [Streptomyces tropicalis]|uniref:FAD binding domain-containing protein n=1 Tax=Streptomyces tropicalis TaxID=3034234 RepID=A0ABT6A6H1_9ACTN|nr:FAD binding domain-containing protein [Streptomyces tropicalis]MDF3300253.1 FAD binding domain-containing protein [Streptomyces tropicalis]
MLLHLPTSVSEARECLADGATPVGGATLVWATWQRDGFPAHAMSLRDVPEADVVGPTALGAAVVLNRIDDRVPEALRRAAAGVGTGAVRRTATVGGNLVGSTLRCLLPAALVLDSRATVLDADGVHETDLAELVAKRPVLLGLHWRAPLASAYGKLPAAPGGPPPLAAALALHAEDDGPTRLRVAVRDGYDVLTGSAVCDSGPEEALRTLRTPAFAELSETAWEFVIRQTADLTRGGPGD